MELNPHPDSSGDLTPFPNYFWAKTIKDAQGRELGMGISVRDHCLNVGCVTEALINALPAPVRPLLPHGTAILAALRHVGKLSAGFQQKCPAWLEEMEFKARWAKEDWNNSEREARSQFRNESSPCA
jgi:hypothetical protein